MIAEVLFTQSRTNLQRSWAETSYQVASLRDNAECVAEEFERISYADDRAFG